MTTADPEIVSGTAIAIREVSQSVEFFVVLE